MSPPTLIRGAKEIMVRAAAYRCGHPSCDADGVWADTAVSLYLTASASRFPQLEKQVIGLRQLLLVMGRARLVHKRNLNVSPLPI